MPRTYDPARRCLKLEEWPEKDRRAWAIALQKGDVLEPGGAGSRWSASSRQTMRESYGRWLAWLQDCGLLDAQSFGVELINPDTASRFAAHLRGLNASQTVANRLQGVYCCAKAMAPERDWAWLREGWLRSCAGIVPVRDKLARMTGIAEVFQFGLELMASADGADNKQSVQTALQYRDGLLIAFLACRPVRRGNLAAVEIGRHLVRCGDVWRLRFEPAETKSRRPIDLALPAHLTPLIERYICVYRPMLLARCRGQGPDLAMELHRMWITTRGTAMKARDIYHRTIALTRSKFGKAMSPHLFRDAAATSIAIEDPRHIGMTRDILGHSKLSTSQHYYNQSRMIDAARSYQARILEIRKNCRDGSACAG
jgi:integrase